MAIETRTPPHTATPTARSTLPPRPASLRQRDEDEDFEAQEGDEDGFDAELERAQGERATGLVRSAWRGGWDAWENGARHGRQWARRHPTQLWGAVGALGLLALWMAYRPALNAARSAGFDPSRQRWLARGADRERDEAEDSRAARPEGARERADRLNP
jgi:hypothetical protein